MAFVPARCESCGLEFQPRATSVTGGGSVIMSNNRTNCPRCSGVTHFVDGAFKEQDGKFRVLSASTVTREMLARLQLLVEEVERDPTKLVSAKARADEIHQGFGSLFSAASWSPEVKAAVIAAMTALIVSKCSPSPTINVQPRLIIEMPVEPVPEPRIEPYGYKPLSIKIRS